MVRKQKDVGMPSPQFVFIDNAQSITPIQKRIIRKQAMRKVAETRKELGTYRKFNLGQYPASTDSEDGKLPNASTMYNPQTSIKNSLPRCMSVQGYEKARITHDFDLFSLSALTSFHFGKATVKALADDPERLREMLRANKESSYLDFVPGLYCTNKLIRSVVNCTLARAQQTICGRSNIPEAKILALYGTALMELQSALQDPLRSLEADVLCATHILAMYEVCHPILD